MASAEELSTTRIGAFKYLAATAEPSLYRNGKVEGRFPLLMPPILLGYEKDEQSPSTGLAPASALALFVTVEPALPPAKETERERMSTRDAKMQEFAAGWIKKLLAALPREQRFERHLRVFAPADDGERTLVCRFVRPQPPPEELVVEGKKSLKTQLMVLRHKYLKCQQIEP